MDRIDPLSRLRLVRLAGLVALATAAGCATLGTKGGGRPLVPTAFKVPTGPYLVCTNEKLDADAPVIRQLRSLDVQVKETLGLKVEPGEHPVKVYILDDRQAFEHYLTFHYPELPHRRAFFLANGDERMVFTFFGDRLEEDIRHEATHALIHVAIGDIPLWLDEGLAEYFEGPAERNGINPEHVSRLPADLESGWAPDLARLESLKGVRQMTPRDYRESWAWVHYLLNEGPAQKAALMGYLADLRNSADARPISSRLDGPTAAPLLAHLARVRENPLAFDAPKKDSTVRLQSGQVEPTRRKGFFGRLRDLFEPRDGGSK